MFLSVDVGNTQTTLGLIGPSGDVCQCWRAQTDKRATSDEILMILTNFLAGRGYSLESVDAVAVASVVPSLQHAWNACLARLRKPHLMVGTLKEPPIPIRMPYPTQVGADRIANAMEALACYGAPVIVVDFGTATNIDVVAPDGAFVGGVIAPGIMLSAEALFQRASKLSSTPIEVPPHTIGSTSEEALQSGIVVGAAAMAEGLVARIQEELGAPGCPVIATGGLARTVDAVCTCFTQLDPQLTLRGIHRIWRHYRGEQG
ncbi:type III pantothenate kinase [Leptogranulimonas caecicola]|jgi:type III pantothenate kinase|uniref:Type III pantothenate kinase n=2 Tax=Coriobacteriales TaxID=84999 RepID=A0A4V3RRC8_9ACTN|nr:MULTISPECIES: type III pantothenate kinase [Atopobiaceae]MCI8675426.1 type III pantothenate kinase [Atopobiaceae bacterium]TGY62970.1 type III pantothenate kinase [Muricaecibacterium torontonense]BDC90313.1 type III pantothenate kinase [Leptogranulimonas caecicola]